MYLLAERMRTKCILPAKTIISIIYDYTGVVSIGTVMRSTER